ARVAEVRVELSSDKIVVIPKDRVALFGTPLIVAENDHRHRRPLIPPDGGHLVHRDAEGAVSGEADYRSRGIADLGADDRRKAIPAWTEQAGRKVLPAAGKHRIGVPDRAVVANIARDDRIAGQRRHDGAP